ncbi:MAG: hypothetical protein G01um101466_567 [Parcubacteria group bacterium Gr01-1014_66]|nr:MAG: hypothetical protein G01um101466_567 [Parcubacteria group bacterium Gr01-1014_66]
MFLRTNYDNFWDWPGGRIDNVELNAPLKSVIAREVKEELGPLVRYKLWKPLFYFLRYFPERRLYIFQLIHEAAWRSGEIILSPEHTRYQWINPKKSVLRSGDFYSKKEYQAFKDYFKAVR